MLCLLFLVQPKPFESRRNCETEESNEMKPFRRFLIGLGIGTIAGVLGSAWQRKGGQLLSDRASANRANDDLEERCDQAENRFASAMAEFSGRLSSLQEQQERCAASLDEGQRTVAVELGRLRTLIIMTLIFSCFGVVAFTIVLFLAYVKY